MALRLFAKQFDELGRQPLLDALGYKLDDLRQPLRVVPYDAKKDLADKILREQLRESGGSLRGKDEDGEKLYRYRSGGLSEKALDVKPRLLDELKPRRLVLLGDPGMGKTEWLKKQARDATGQALRAIRNFAQPLASVQLPVFARLPEVSEALATGAGGDTLARFLHQNGCTTQPLSTLTDSEQFAAALLKVLYVRELASVPFLPELWLRLTRPAASGLARLYLDSLDEVTDNKAQLAECLSRFQQMRPELSIYLTSRLVGYDTAPLTVARAFTGPDMELELCEFEREDTNNFIAQFYAGRADIGAALQRELAGKPSVSGLERIYKDGFGVK